MPPRRPGNIFKSDAFNTSPVPLKSGKGDPHREFEIKGKHKDVYQHIGGDNDEYVIGKDNKFKISRKTLKENIQQLKLHATKLVTQLSAADNQLYVSVLEALRLVQTSPKVHAIMMKDIHDCFKDVKNYKPGSVAAVFIGCTADDDFNHPIGCNPKCATATLSNIHLNSPQCEDAVLFYDREIFKVTNDVKSDNAFIYIADSRFTGFTAGDIAILKKNGFVTAIIVKSNANGSYQEIGNKTNIDALPTRGGNSQQTTNTNSGAGAIIAIVIIVILLILLFVAYKQYNM